MRAGVLTGPGTLEVREVPRPVPGPGDLLVRVEACGICPSDIRLWQSGHSDLLTLPAVIGHEAVGVVCEVGSSADETLLGRRVFVDGYGGFAEFTMVTAAARQRQRGPFLLPDNGLTWDVAVFAEPLADCMYAVEHCADPGTAETAFVAGCGQMGLQLVRLLALRGIAVVASDPLPYRRELALRFGAAQSIDPGVDQKPTGMDLAMMACPVPEAAQDCLESLAPGGVCVLFSSLPAGKLAIDLNMIHKRRLRIAGSRWVIGRREPHYELYRQAVRLLADGLVDVDPLVDLRVPFDGLLDSFSAMGEARVLKAVLHPDGDLSPR